MTVRRPSVAFGLLGSGVVGGKVTDFVDLGALLAEAHGSSLGPLEKVADGRSVLLVESAKMARGVLRSYLEIHGYAVVEAAGLKGAVEALERTSIDLVLTAIDLGGDRGSEILDAVRRLRGAEGVPVIGLTDAHGSQTSKTDEALFDFCTDRIDRAAILHAIQTVTAQNVNRCTAERELNTECAR